MSVMEKKEAVRRYFLALEARDVKAAVDCWSDAPFNHGRQFRREDIARPHAALFQVYERWIVHELIGEGDWVVCQLTAEGHHKARPAIPFDSGIHGMTEPDGRAFSFQHIHMFRIVDGKIQEHWASRDDLGAARQLGLELAAVGDAGKP